MPIDWADRKSIEEYVGKVSHEPGKVMAREDKRRALFEKYSHLVMKGFDGHLNLCNGIFGKNALGGTGVLDIGTGDAGVYLADYMTEHFLPPRIGIDIFKANVPATGWLSISMDANEILSQFGASTFDHVQCMETLEHVDEDKATDIATQMTKVSRSTCLITSCGLAHHLGELNLETVKENQFLIYKGQPNIEALMNLGYKVRLLGRYQILAWHIK